MADKVHKVMREFKEGELHSGSKTGPRVSSRSQALAIALSEAGKSRSSKHNVGTGKSHFNGKTYKHA